MGRADLTKQRLQDEAIRLFTARGFDNVTVDEVATAAGVSHMTFFRHFPTKESVVFDDPYDPLLGTAVARQDHDVPPIERVRRAVLEAWREIDEPDDEMTRARIQLAASHPGLRARIWQNNLDTEDVIVASLRETGSAELEARVAAGAVLGALTAALFDWASHDETGSLGDRVRLAMGVLTGEAVQR